MKTLKKIILFPFKLIQQIIGLIFDTIGTIIISVGLLLLGISLFIKNYKKAKFIINTTLKKIIE